MRLLPVFLLVISFIRLFSNNVYPACIEYFADQVLITGEFQQNGDQKPHILIKLNNQLQAYLNIRDTLRSHLVADSISDLLKSNPISEDRELAKSYYLSGAYYSITGNQSKAIRYFELSQEINRKYPDDEINMRCTYYLGYAYNIMGDYIKSNDFFVRSLNLLIKKFGNNSVNLIPIYQSLAISNTVIRDYEKTIKYVNMGIDIAKNHPDSVTAKQLALFYQIKGVAFSDISDYNQAIVNLLKAEYIYLINSLTADENYLSLIDNIAAAYHFLGSKDKVLECYEKSLKFAQNTNYPVSFSILKNYSIILGNNGMADKGEKILSSSLSRVMKVYSANSREYFKALKDYADYLRVYKIDIKKSLDLYLRCSDYIKTHDWDHELKNDILVGLSLSLVANGESGKALDTLQALLFADYKILENKDPYINPGIEKITYDKRSLLILDAKYQILWDIYFKSKDLKVLESAASTSELIVCVLERMRLNVGEEESRILLGDKYRNSYLNTIKCYYICYERSQNPFFLEKVYEYSEKSKVASLLASFREMKATQLHVPPDLMNMESTLRREINFYTAKIDEEDNNKAPDEVKIRSLTDNVMSATQKRDSLKAVFERNYPDYYSIKYNTQVLKLQNIPGIIGRNNNYLSYVMTDSSLYILIINRKYEQLISIKIDSSFFQKISKFRKILSQPDFSINSSEEFLLYQKLGYDLYLYLIEPISKFLISDRLIISPDNVLSYFPFETLLSKSSNRTDILYRKLPYVMNSFQISYSYSATLMAETAKKTNYLINRTMAFAPSFASTVNIDSLMINRQLNNGTFSDLPYAREEATYVSKVCKGKSFLNESATEANYKNEAGKFDIIHLATHTLINDRDPMYSKMIFSTGSDTIEDGFLNTYEIYGIPLKAKMVVLSSCNTGTGMLHSGEGILSLARGFIYSGSLSVVMSLWEVEDRSGTEIIKLFYENLKKGYSKSSALKKSRVSYLQKANQLKSHPYFWSTMVVYGNDAPLYLSRKTVLAVAVITTFLIVLLIYYSRKRRYS
jgi:CHAT domain-containing protein/tetratricopeptide (TPR) repeat protein